MSSKPGEEFEVRQTSTSEDWTPDPSKSIKLSPERQALVDDIIALYSCEPTIKRVERYTADCVYDDQFVYANDRYKMAGQWFALPKLFKDSKNERYEIIKNDRDLIQFKNEQSWTFKIIPKTATINALVSLSLDPDTVDSDFIQVKYHKDQANDKDYSHEGIGFSFKKWQADQVMKHMNSEEVKYFEKDKNAAKQPVKKYGSGDVDGAGGARAGQRAAARGEVRGVLDEAEWPRADGGGAVGAGGEDEGSHRQHLHTRPVRSRIHRPRGGAQEGEARRTYRRQVRGGIGWRSGFS